MQLDPAFMPSRLPTTRKAITVVKALGSKNQKPVTHDALLTELPLSAPKPGEVVVRIEAAGFNHREVSDIRPRSKQCNSY
jgi:NADPH:quinone reductase-like Zn-dependent oxidoreductase